MPHTPPPTPEFLAACADAGVAAGHRLALWNLHCTWWPAKSDKDRLTELLTDYGHWQLFASSADGDAESAAAFERYWADNVRLFIGRGFTPEQVDEFRGLFFERVYRKAADFAWSSPFIVYLRTILVNLARDELRRVRRNRGRVHSLDSEPRDAPVTAAQPDPLATLLDQERRQAVRQALAELAPMDRRILAECLVDDRSGQELAAELGIKRDALYQRLRRAKKRLKARLERDDRVSDR